MAAVEGVRIGGPDGPLRKKPRVADLPISSAKRSSVEGLLHVFKKKGEFDSLRKKVYAQFEDGAFTDEEIEREPAKYLGKDRRLAAPLLEGAAARADIYPTTEADIERYISAYLSRAEQVLRELREKEIGVDAAREEAARGAKSDDAYAADAQVRRSGRAKKHVEAMKLKKKQEKAEARKRELEALKKRAMELTKEKEKLERDQKRRAEREAARAKQKAMEEERRKKFAEERDRKEKEAAEATKRAEEEKERRRKEKEAADAKHLEQEAMRQLLRDGERLAEKTGRRLSIDRGVSPDPSRRGPPRRGRSPSPGGSIRRMSGRDDGDRGTRTSSPRREIRRDDRRRDDGSVRNRSRSPIRRRYSRSPGPRRPNRSWSRSPPPRRAYRQRDYSPPPRRRRSRSRSPVDIDRYVPSSGSRRDDHRDRDRDRDRRIDRDRDHDRRDRDRERDRDRDVRGDKDRERDRSRHRERDREHDRDGKEREGKRPRPSSKDRHRSPPARARSRSR